MIGFITFIDKISMWFGKAFAWLILLMTLGMSYEVLVRYMFGRPTPWAFDLSYMMYGGLFMMAGAYTLSRNAHVRADFIYRLWPVRRQAAIELILYIFFFFPGVLALTFPGWKYASRSWQYQEVSQFSPAGIPIFQFKTIMVVAGVLLVIQGIAQVCRCIVAMRTGQWPQQIEDVEELEAVLLSKKDRSAVADLLGETRQTGTASPEGQGR